MPLLRHSSTWRDHSARLLFSFITLNTFDTLPLLCDCVQLKAMFHNSFSIVHFSFIHIFAQKLIRFQHGDGFDGYYKTNAGNPHKNRFSAFLYVIPTPLCKVVMWCFSLIFKAGIKEFYMVSTYCVDFLEIERMYCHFVVSISLPLLLHKRTLS